MEQATLTPLDSAEVTILVDGFVDVLRAGSDVARRPPLVPELVERDPLRAEHGYALLLTVVEGGRRRSSSTTPDWDATPPCIQIGVGTTQRFEAGGLP